MEALDQAQVRRVELRLVEVVVNGFASDRITKADFRMFLVVNVTLTGAVVESGLTAFSLQLGKTQEAEFRRALKRQLRIVLREDFVVLRRDHLILAFDTTKARQEKVFDSRKINSHCSLLP